VIDLQPREVPAELDDIVIEVDGPPAADGSSVTDALVEDSEESAAFGHS
jgi:hypothetical protein